MVSKKSHKIPLFPLLILNRLCNNDYKEYVPMFFFSAIKLLKIINPWKTLYFNFHYFPLSVAIRIPFYICWRTELYKMNGRIVLDSPIERGMVVFGGHSLGTQDLLYSRSMWDVSGTLIVKGNAYIGRGSKISIGKDAALILGDNFVITGNSQIICMKQITFGRGCLLSWDILIMDADFHSIMDTDGRIINASKSIIIGNHVWIGCRNTILKGVSIADNNVVSANSTITKSVNESNCIIGGHGKSVEILKKNVNWNS